MKLNVRDGRLVYGRELLKALTGCKAKTQHIPSEIQESFHKPYKLNHVIDGDTIVANDEKIRLWVSIRLKRTILLFNGKALAGVLAV